MSDNKNTNHGEATIYVRVDSKLKKQLKTFINGTTRSERLVIECLLDHLFSLSPAEQEALLKGESSLLQNFGTAVEAIAWGEHAFNRNEWEWALEAYRFLEEVSGHSRGLNRLALYKQGFCWLEIAASLRREALATAGSEEEWLDYFSEAGKCIDICILTNEKFLNLGTHPVVRFNIACGWSLRAQYKAEGLCGFPLLQQADAESCSLFLQNWRKYINNDANNQFLTNYTLNCSLNSIQHLTSMVEDGYHPDGAMTAENYSPSNPTFLVRAITSDSDFDFLRNDPEARKLLRAWLDRFNLEERKLTTFRNLWSRLSEAT